MREKKLAQVRERTTVGDYPFVFGFYCCAIGGHSISEEFVGFFLYGFPEDKYLFLLSLVIDFCACYSLRLDPKIILSN